MVTSAALLTIGHLVFERRRPAMIDNPAHLLVGPMFVAAKLVVALGSRRHGREASPGMFLVNHAFLLPQQGFNR